MWTSAYYVTHHDSLQLVNSRQHYMMFFQISFMNNLKNFTLWMSLKQTHGQTKIIICTVFKHSKIWFQNSSSFAQSLTIVPSMLLFLVWTLWLFFHGGQKWCIRMVVMQLTIARWWQLFMVIRPLSLQDVGYDKLILSWHDGSKLGSTIFYHNKDEIQHRN